MAGMCTVTSSCTVNEGRHFESVYVVAHEIGHKLVMLLKFDPNKKNKNETSYKVLNGFVYKNFKENFNRVTCLSFAKFSGSRSRML